MPMPSMTTASRTGRGPGPGPPRAARRRGRRTPRRPAPGPRTGRATVRQRSASDGRDLDGDRQLGGAEDREGPASRWSSTPRGRRPGTTRPPGGSRGPKVRRRRRPARRIPRPGRGSTTPTPGSPERSPPSAEGSEQGRTVTKPASHGRAGEDGAAGDEGVALGPAVVGQRGRGEPAARGEGVDEITDRGERGRGRLVVRGGERAAIEASPAIAPQEGEPVAEGVVDQGRAAVAVFEARRCGHQRSARRSRIIGAHPTSPRSRPGAGVVGRRDGPARRSASRTGAARTSG